jgi:hypothetical protein
MTLTDDDIVTLGMFSEALLQDPNWQRLVDVFEQQQFATFASTEAKAVKEREKIYDQLLGARMFLSTLADFAKLKAQIIERNISPSSTDDVI